MKSIEVVAGVIKYENKIYATQRGYGEFKDYWEFPGGKIEANETRKQALARELKEELAVDVLVEDFICTVEYDYPKFHLIMHCFFCSIVKGSLTLLEHEAAKWLSVYDLQSVNWLPADVLVAKIVATKFKDF